MDYARRAAYGPAPSLSGEGDTVRFVHCLALFFGSLCLCRQADASDPCCHPWRRVQCPTCCDDYCRRPLPPIYRLCYCGQDDYCPKPLPYIFRLKCCGCDDYCPKPLPMIQYCYPPWYTCGPDHCCCP